MPRQGLTTQTVIAAAADLLEEIGLEQLSLHRLAEKLNVRTASLYTHIDGFDHLRTLLVERALQLLGHDLDTATAGRTPDDAVRALCTAYCTFARENREMYRLVLTVPHNGNQGLVDAGRAVKRILFDLLALYTADRALQIQLSRELHSLLHGFVGLEQLGFFDPAVSIDDSLDAMIEGFLHRLHALPA